MPIGDSGGERRQRALRPRQQYEGAVRCAVRRCALGEGIHRAAPPPSTSPESDVLVARAVRTLQRLSPCLSPAAPHQTEMSYFLKFQNQRKIGECRSPVNNQDSSCQKAYRGTKVEWKGMREQKWHARTCVIVERRSGKVSKML